MTIPTKSMKSGEEDYAIACMVPVKVIASIEERNVAPPKS